MEYTFGVKLAKAAARVTHLGRKEAVKKMTMRLNRQGFTLVEIMIVVAIIALLAAIAIPNLLRARVNANESAAQSTLKSYATALETYIASEGEYPALETNLVPEYYPLLMDGRTKGGYTYDADDGVDLTTSGYTVTADSPGATIGRFDYQITTGARLQRRASDSVGTFTDF